MTRLAWSLLLSVALAASSTPAAACRAPNYERYVFLPALPKLVPEGTVVLQVAPVDQSRPQVATVRVVRAIKGRVSTRTLLIELAANSCSRSEFLVTPAYLVGTPSSVRGRFNPVEFRLDQLQGVELLDGSVRISPHP